MRLLVSDGMTCIQAVLKGETFGLVDDGQVYAGCYIRVDNFELRFLDLLDGREGTVEANNATVPVPHGQKKEKATRARKMVYLLLDNPITVGWNTAYMRILEAQKQKLQPNPTTLPDGWEEKEGESELDTTGENRPPPPADTVKAVLDIPQSPKASPDYGSAPEIDAVNFDSTDRPKLEAPQPEHDITTTPAQPTNHVLQPSSTTLPWTADDPTKPVKLTPLRLIPNLPYKQNWMVNVLAVVASISDVEPSHLPPYHQRTARLTDPSTSKQVLLTVFLDPDDFTPAVGSVVLILGVKNHRFDGGSLKKYVSDRPKKGVRWWFEEPEELGWCDVAGLRSWWDNRRAAG